MAMFMAQTDMPGPSVPPTGNAMGEAALFAQLDALRSDIRARKSKAIAMWEQSGGPGSEDPKLQERVPVGRFTAHLAKETNW